MSPTEKLFEELPTRAELVLQPLDVLFAKNNSSRGTSVLVPEWLDGGLATSGFISIRPEDEENALILWSSFRLEAWRKQVYYLAITASQPEVRDDIFANEMLVSWPANEEQHERIVGSARAILRARERERLALEANRQTLQEVLGEVADA